MASQVCYWQLAVTIFQVTARLQWAVGSGIPSAHCLTVGAVGSGIPSAHCLTVWAVGIVNLSVHCRSAVCSEVRQTFCTLPHIAAL